MANFTFKMKIALGMIYFFRFQLWFRICPNCHQSWSHSSNAMVSILLCCPSAHLRPSTFKQFLSYLNPANLDFVQLSSIGCVQTFTFFDKLVFYSFFPIIVFILIVMVI